MERLIVRFFLRYGLHNSFPKVAAFLAKRRMDPYFFIVGFQKSGTTSIYEQLMEIPLFEKGLAKEVPEMSKKSCNKNYFKLFFPKKNAKYITGNACHLDIYSPHGVVNIKNHFPNSKIIVIMRNPSDRAYSHFLMDKKFGWIGEKVSFDDYIDFELKILEKINIEDVNELYENTKWLNHPFGMLVGKGVYYTFIKNMVDNGIDFLPVCLENYQKNFDFEFKKILNFLEIENNDFSKTKIKHSNRNILNEIISDNSRSKLDSFYKEYNEKLFDLIGFKYPW
jgi:hypothetical protein